MNVKELIDRIWLYPDKQRAVLCLVFYIFLNIIPTVVLWVNENNYVCI